MKDINRRKVLIVEDQNLSAYPAMRHALENLAAILRENSVDVIFASDCAEALPLVNNDMDIDALLLAADISSDGKDKEMLQLLTTARGKLPEIPIFLLADRGKCAELVSEKWLEKSTEFVWIFEDSPVFISGRILAAIERFRANLLPPLFKAIADYNEHFHEYSWAAPGHQGGRGFTKSCSGKKFYDFYDENLFRTDTGIERSSIGSLLDHTGAFADCETLAAKTFGADMSFSGVVGTSGSNRTVMQAAIPPGETVICDRNCHKSIEQGLILTRAYPIYMLPSRNAYGIIGPIPAKEMTPEAIAAKCAAAKRNFPAGKSSYAVVTNCTYDGLCYHAENVQNLLEKSSDRIHFDEAWYAYARFNKLYSKHFAMRGEPGANREEHATIFATHSTHKLLTALSQASFIHIRQGRRPIDFDRFNQAYMMHTTTSPLYAICASNDIASKVMADSGEALTGEVISEAIDFRQAVAKVKRDFARKHDWFFDIWNRHSVTLHGKRYDFADAPKKLLGATQEVWHLDPGDDWHGFADIDRDWAMLDPIKVSIIAPGIDIQGNFAAHGVPGELVSAYLYHEGIIPTRTTDFQLMFLFSVGITKGKWVTLLNALINFKSAYDANAPLEKVLPELAAVNGGIYRGVGLRTLGEKMFTFLREHQLTGKLNDAYRSLPQMAILPHEAFAKIASGETEMVPLEELPGRIAATAVIPYPPGIPLLISGEVFGSADSPHLGYLKALSDWDHAFPGFGHETEGCQITDGVYHVMCVKK